ncbi:hypothetical protein A9Q84_13245 [Halobacteriovorax marinus]|uniref:Radical SAM core domain-containing protein n=1 Tax=Halobacteriovorax marinus TaxID=97084 RepID=A0A1Y5F8N5_9BACT|nr:hypothetical protein A9Q84_13245 [Halobacteriovorax marinus]
MEIQHDGNIFPCGRGQFNTPLGNSKIQTPEDVWNSKGLKELRLGMLAGKKSDYCSDCYRIESCNGVSPRKQHLKSHQSELALVDETFEDGSLEVFSLKHLGLRFSNTCNIKCNYCDHNFSTSWFKDQRALGIDPKLLVHHQPFETKDGLIDFITRNLAGLESVYIAGGEPLLEKAHLDFLDLLIKEDRCDIQITYNTNLTKITSFGASLCERWKHFDQIVIDASIDSHGERNDYIRYGSKFKDLENNLRELSKYSNIQTRIYCTVSKFNILTLGESILYWLENKLIKENCIIFNVLESPRMYNIQTLSSSQKLQVSENFKALSKHLFQHYEMGGALQLSAKLKELLTFLGVADLSHLEEEFVKRCTTLDSLRGCDWVSVFPELNSIALD